MAGSVPRVSFHDEPPPGREVMTVEYLDQEYLNMASQPFGPDTAQNNASRMAEDYTILWGDETTITRFRLTSPGEALERLILEDPKKVHTWMEEALQLGYVGNRPDGSKLVLAPNTRYERMVPRDFATGLIDPNRNHPFLEGLGASVYGNGAFERFLQRMHYPGNVRILEPRKNGDSSDSLYVATLFVDEDLITINPTARPDAHGGFAFGVMD